MNQLLKKRVKVITSKANTEKNVFRKSNSITTQTDASKVKKTVKKKLGKTRYSDTELEEFKAIVMKKIEAARKEYKFLQAQINKEGEPGSSRTESTFKGLEEGAATLEREHLGQMAGRQLKFIKKLEDALVRIENKTYGICRETGVLIKKERLRIVPHATLSMEAKLKQS